MDLEDLLECFFSPITKQHLVFFLTVSLLGGAGGSPGTDCLCGAAADRQQQVLGLLWLEGWRCGDPAPEGDGGATAFHALPR